MASASMKLSSFEFTSSNEDVVDPTSLKASGVFSFLTHVPALATTSSSRVEASRPIPGSAPTEVHMTCTHWLAAMLTEIEAEASLYDTSLLGCSDAERFYNVESERPMSWHTHDGEAELRLWEDGE